MLKNNKHLETSRGMPCTLCNAPPRSDPHHITYAEKRGVGQKVGDNFTVPLCRMCHTKLHNFKFGEKLFWALEGIDPIELTGGLFHGKENT